MHLAHLRQCGRAAADTNPSGRTLITNVYRKKRTESEPSPTHGNEKKRGAAGAPPLLVSTSLELSGDFFQKLLIYIEVGMNVLNIVVLFESFHESDHGIGLRTFELDVGIGNHAHAR